MIIEDNKVVGISYSLMDANFNLIDSNEGYAPLIYLHGVQNIIDGLETALYGMTLQEEKEIVIAPEHAYGLRDANKVYSLLATDFGSELVSGDAIQLDDGREAMIQSRKGDTIIIDENHPLAGVTLHYNVKVVSIREATREERMKGFPVAESNPSFCIPGSGCC